MSTSDLRLAVPAVLTWLVAAVAVGLEPAPSLGSAAVAVGGALVVGILAWRRRRRPGPVGAVVLAMACVAAVLVSAGAQGASRVWLRECAAQRATATVEGVVQSAPIPLAGFGPTRYQVTVDVHQATVRGVTQTARGPVTVVGGPQWRDIGYGSEVRAQGRLDRRDGDVMLRSGDPPAVLSGPSPGVVAEVHTALARVTADLSPQARGLVPGVALGDTARIDDDLDAALRATSLTHITAVSGSHFAIVISVIGGLVASARRPIRAVVIAVAMVGFVLLVHPQPSVLRAAGMGVVGVLAIAWGRPSRAVAALGAAVIVLLVLDPWLARSYGFVLSALATAGIALGAPVIARRIAPWCGRTLATALAVPVAAQAAVAPVLVLLDPVLTPYAVPANLLAAPALAPATVLGVGAALLAPLWPPGALILARLAGVFTGWIATVATTLAAMPGARVPWWGGTFGATILAAATIGVVLILARACRSESDRPPLDVRAALRSAGPGRVIVTGGVVVACVVAVVWVMPWAVTRAQAPPADWVVAACDVGQGDALAVRSGPESVVLVDVGPDPVPVARCLDELGVERVDLVALTHYHADHIGGLAGVLRLPVDGALVPGPAGQPAAERASTLEELSGARIATTTATTGLSGRAGAASWTVVQAADQRLGPAAEGEDESEANDAGVVLLIEVDGLSIMVLGDLEEAGQSRLVAAVKDPVDIVKVAHHGSASQSDRLARRLSARIALVSVGENTYGHPTDRALDLYRVDGAVVARTDHCGTVTVLLREGGLAMAGCG